MHMVYSERINSAIRAASYAHDGQFRRGIPIPYIMHPFAVALISQKYVDDEDVFIACLFHDVLEDVAKERYAEKDILSAFGSTVLSIVQDVTEPRVNAKSADAWQRCKDGYLEHLAEVNDMRPLIVSAADKIHNMTEIIELHKSVGSGVWKYFAAPREKEIWFYEATYQVLRDKIIPTEAIEDYESKLNQLKKLC